MKSLPDRFDVAAGDLIITPVETQRERLSAFMRPFGFPPVGGIFFDRSGHPVSVRPQSIDGLGKYAAFELERAASAIAYPQMICRLWVRGSGGQRLWTYRYLADVNGVAVAVDINRDGWSFSTSEDPCFVASDLVKGEIAWETSVDKKGIV